MALAGGLRATEADLVEACLRAFHGDGDYGWRLIKQTWPEAAVSEQRRKMGIIIDIVRISLSGKGPFAIEE